MTLEQYRHHVAQLEAEVERANRLYEQTESVVHRDQLELAKTRATQARHYLRKREKRESA